MERKDPFIESFLKAASLAAGLKSFKTKALVAGGAGLGLYGAGKALKSMEDPEQAQLRKLRKANALPYQQRINP